MVPPFRTPRLFCPSSLRRACLGSFLMGLGLACAGKSPGKESTGTGGMGGVPASGPSGPDSSSDSTGGKDAGAASGGQTSGQQPDVYPPSSEDDPWFRVVIPGAQCADGSEYPIFVKKNEAVSDLVLTFEPGGACWDYETCTARGEQSRAFHLDGIAPNHMVALPPPLGTVEDGIPWGRMSPHLGLSDRSVPTAGYNQVYFPYCTGDAFLGNFAAKYENADGSDSVTIHHRGARNVELALSWLTEEFPSPDHLLVVGASAGALGSTMHYAQLREAFAPQRASLINDSGPIFPPGGPQTRARLAFAERYRTDALTARLDALLDAPTEQSLREDSGYILELLSRRFPEDRLLQTYFLSDLNYTIFSYVGFYEDESVENLLELWQEDTALLIEHIEDTDNWGYFIPGFRADNCSHTLTLLPALELTDPGYLSAVLRGSAQGYLRTELGALDFGDALKSTVDPDSDLVREFASDPQTAFTTQDEAYCLRWLD